MELVASLCVVKNEMVAETKMAEIRRTRGAGTARKKPITGELFTTRLFIGKPVERETEGVTALSPGNIAEAEKTAWERGDFASVMTAILRGREP